MDTIAVLYLTKKIVKFMETFCFLESEVNFFLFESVSTCIKESCFLNQPNISRHFEAIISSVHDFSCFDVKEK